MLFTFKSTNMKRAATSMMGVSVIAIVVSGTLLLSACSAHKNPLTQTDKKTASTFLVNASEHTEKALKYTPEKAIGGDYYGQCMAHKHAAKNCEKLYKGMLQYATTQPDFKSLSKSDLTNQKVWVSLKDTYGAVSFDNIS